MTAGEQSLEQLDQSVWLALERATADRHHEWRSCAFGTVGITEVGDARESAAPSMRMVILRDVNREHQTLLFYTDARSKKVSELAVNPRASLLFWNARSNWQLRMQAEIQVVKEGRELDARWRQVETTRGAVDYQSTLPPGAPLGRTHPAIASESSSSTHHFVILRAKVLSCDSLELRREGHRRASFDYVTATSQWLQP
jgi:pyridoxamine 5'-phosphate oxidase